MIQMQTECCKCGVVLKFTKEDIKPLNKLDKENLEKRNLEFKKMLEETKTIGFIGKKIVKKLDGEITRDFLYRLIIEAYGKITCPLCNTEQLLSKK